MPTTISYLCCARSWLGVLLLLGVASCSKGKLYVSDGGKDANGGANGESDALAEHGPDVGGASGAAGGAGQPGGDGGPGLDCPALDNPIAGVVAVPSLMAGSTATYTCNLGATLGGAGTRTCQADGTWSGAAPTCASKDCGPLVAPPSGTVKAPSTVVGATATYACGAGFGPSGSTTRTCQLDGTWSGTDPTCVVANCPALPGPAGGTVAAPTLTFGSTATYACNTGYTLRGTATSLCQTDGTWSGTAPACILATCPSLAGPSGGSVVATGLTYMATATYSCDAGYLLAGSTTRTCQASGFWSGTQPTCNPVDCLAPGAPQHGTVTAAATTLGSIAQYACNAGYDLSGATTRTCQTNGAWNGAVPSCVPKDCGPPSGTANGSVSATTTTLGSTATYTCATNYALSPSGASGTRTCQTDGTWSVPVPACADVCSVTGVGSASHCCTNANCPASTPVCNASHACGPRPLGGTCSGVTGECGSNPCVNGICCQTTCTGVCNTGSCTGAGATCELKPVRTPCGTIKGSNPNTTGDPDDQGNDITLLCNSAGQCKGPTVSCNPATNGACDLTSNFCCNRPDGQGGGTMACAATSCGTSANLQQIFGENCDQTSDCPLGSVCCYAGGFGYGWLICRTSCDAFPICTGGTPCPAGTSCTGSIYQALYCQ